MNPERPFEENGRGSGGSSNPPPRPAWARFSVAVGSVVAALLLRDTLTPVIGPTGFALTLFFPAVTAAAWFGGFAPGLTAIALSAIVANWFFIEPRHALAITGVGDITVMLLFLLGSGFIVAVVETIRRGRARLAREVEERIRAEARIAEAHERLETTMASIGDGVVVTDPEGLVTSLNRQAERLTGWRRSDAVGKPLATVFRIVNEQTREPVENPVARVLREGTVVALTNHAVLLTRDGREMPIDDSAAPIRRAGGPILGVVLVFRDATDQRRAHDVSAQLAAIVEFSGDAIFTKDLDGIVRTWNRSAERLFGYGAEEIVGRPNTVLIPPDRHDEEAEVLGRLRQGQPSERLETVRVAKDGRSIPVWVSVSPLRDPDGRVIGASKIVHDVSDVLAAREALHHEKELLATTLASIGDGVIVTDAGGRITFLNAEAERLTAWTNADARGETLPAVFRIVNEETRATVENPVDKALRLGSVVGLANHTVLIGKDGTERAIDDSAAPIRVPGGDLSGVVLVFRDVTERRRWERELEESQRWFHLMADAAPVLVWVSGTDKRCTWFNKGWLDFVGRPMEREVGNGWRENVHPEDVDGCLQTYVSAFDARAPFSMTYRLRRHDGEYRWVLNHAVPLHDASGAFSGYIASCVDVAESVQAELARREADRRKDEFLAILSHELRNPLAPIRMAVGMLRQIGPPDPELVELREIIERQTAQLARLLDDLLDVSRIASGKVVLRKERISLGLAISSAVESVRPVIRSREHELFVTVPEEPIHLDGDLGRLAQVFTNLLHNAAKYTGNAGRITLTVEREGSEVLVRVRDNGIGLAPEQRTRVFEMFAQVDDSPERGQGGLGVGLSLAKTLIEMHGGSIEVRSEGIGKGAEFTVRLPILAAAGPAAAPPAAPRAELPAAALPGAAGLRILVADDNSDSAAVLAWALRRAGHEVRVANDGASAVEIAGAFRPKLAILDIGMPRMNGYDVARAIRSQLGDAVALVAVTGWGQEEDKRRAADAGFDHHVTKPVDLAALERLVTQLC